MKHFIQGIEVKQMDRLTARDGFGAPYYPYCDNVKGCGGYCAQCNFETKTMDKLAQYEDLEEQGLLLKLPCPIGTEVWTIMCGMTGKHPTLFKQSFEYSMIEHFGKAVFLTKDEARNKIEEMSK